MLISMRWRLQVYFEWRTTFSREKNGLVRLRSRERGQGVQPGGQPIGYSAKLVRGGRLGSLVGHKFPRAPDAVMSRGWT